MTATTRASLGFAAAAAFVAVLIVGAAAGARAQNTNGAAGPLVGRGGPQRNSQGGPGGRFGGRGGPGGPMGGPMGALGPIMRQVNLTDAQREQVRSIVESHRDEMQALGERARPAHDALEETLSNGTFDEGTIRARSAEVATVEADMAVVQARVYSEVFQILTPEQQAQVAKLQAEMKDRRPERGRGPRPPLPR